MATLKDVASACGCSVATVSRALRSDGRIAPATVARIQATATRLGYRPNLAARALITGRSRTVLFLLGELSSPTNHNPAEAAARRCRTHGLDLLVATHHGDAAAHERIVERLGQGLADGVLIVADPVTCASEALKVLLRSGFPAVFVDRHVPRLRVPLVSTDNVAATEALVERVASAGARWIAHSFRDDNPVEVARAAGAAAAATRLGLPCLVRPRLEELPSSGPLCWLDTGCAAIRRLAAHPQRQDRLLLAGVFDAWHGDPPSAARIWVAEQDFTAMADAACDRLVLRIDASKDPAGSRATLVPIRRIQETGPSAFRP